MQRLIASWFGTGLLLGRLRGSDLGSGTLASLVVLVPALALGLVAWWAQLAAAVVTASASLWASRPFSRDGADPGWVVIDEAAGTFLTVTGLGLWPAIVAFVVFRLADATKRFPGVAAAERLPGAIGITADDLVAAAWGWAAGGLAALLFFG